MTLGTLLMYLNCLILLTSVAQQCLSVTPLGGISFDGILESYVFVTLYGQSLLDCQGNCASRPKCKSINYYRRSPFVCQLSSGVVPVGSSLAQKAGWVYQALEEWQSENTCETCTEAQVCESGTCEVRECSPLTSTDDFRVLGNKNNIGAKAVLACHDGEYPTDQASLSTWPVQSVCLKSGWSVTGLTCGAYEPVCRDYLYRSTPVSRYKTQKINLIDGECGVEDDNKLTASSTHLNDNSYAPSMIRFNRSDNAWVSNLPCYGSEYVQVEFDAPIQVIEIVTKGRGVGNQHVSKYKVQVSNDSFFRWPTVVLDESGNEDFTGNNDDSSEFTNVFQTPVTGQYVRVIPIQATGLHAESYCGMQFDLHGTINLPIF